MVYRYHNTGSTATAAAATPASNRNGHIHNAPPRATSAGALVKTNNNYDTLPPPMREAALSLLQDTIATHGQPPCTRDVAVAHEAGHVIVAVALLGGRLPANASTAVGRESNGGWCGYTTLGQAGLGQDGGPVFYVAGLAGEALAGLVHPASSVEELLPAIQGLLALRLLVRGDGVATGARVHRYDGKPLATAYTIMAAERILTGTALHILQANKPQWEAVRRAFHKRETLGYAALAKRVAGVRLPDDWRASLDGFFNLDDAQIAALMAAEGVA